MRGRYLEEHIKQTLKDIRQTREVKVILLPSPSFSIFCQLSRFLCANVSQSQYIIHNVVVSQLHLHGIAVVWYILGNQLVQAGKCEVQIG